MHFIQFIATALLPVIASALSRRAVRCDYETTAPSGTTCESFASSWGLSVDRLTELNPSITCPNLDASRSYCVIGTVIKDPPSTTLTTSTTTQPPSTSTTTTTTTTTTTAPGGPSPTQPGIIESCIAFYKVEMGDYCYAIVESYGNFTLDQFYEWNPAVGTQCAGLQAGYYVCVGIETATTTTTSPPATTTPPNTPQQPNIDKDCTKFHLVIENDSCAGIAAQYGATLADFYRWNPSVGSSCGGLWLGYYVCVGTSTSQPTTTTTSRTTTTTTTAPGPSPTQPGLIKTCTNYYKVQAGDTCEAIVREKYPYVNSLALFVRWNPAVGSDCLNLLTGYYYCVATELHQPMPGIVSNCKRYYQVRAGDDCWSIQQRYGITAAEFNRWNPRVGGSCQSLWQGYFVCVAA